MPSLIQSAFTLARGAARGAIVSLDELRKSQGGPAPSQAAANPAKSLMLDPYNGLLQMGYRDRNSAVSYDMLRQMVKNTPVVSAILRTRINQLATFATPQANKYDLGFKIKLKDAKANPSKGAQKRIDDIERFIVQCGVPDNARYRDNFAKWIKKTGRDTLTIGHDATEIISNRKGEPAEFLAVDATTIRLAEELPENDELKPDEVIRYVQTYDEQVVAEYTFDEMMFGIRLPATDLKLQGYGECELEMLVEVITNLLNISSYNGNFFSNNSVPRGLINIRGEMSGDMLEGFRRHWYAMLSGVENAFVTPIANARDGIEFIPMSQTNNDMQMQQWNEIQTRAACAVFSISPEEIGFGMGQMGVTSSLSTPTNTDKIVEGRERGLLPLLNHFAHNLNNHVVNRIDEDFYLDFVGLAGLTREQQTQQAQAQVRNFRTVNEVRADDDLPPLPKGTGDIILDPIYMQNRSMKEQAEMQAQAQGQGGGQAGGEQDPQEYQPDNPDEDEQNAEQASDANGGGGGQNDDTEDDNAQLARSLGGPLRLTAPGLRPLTKGDIGWFRAEEGG